MLATLAAHHFSRYPGTQAVYLSRGLASGSIVPGVSDIDFNFFGNWDRAVRQTMGDRYDRLARWLPVFDPSAMDLTLTPEDAHAAYEADPFWTFRFHQAKQHWQLVHGTDILAALPALPANRAMSAAVMENRLWWTIFVNRTLAPDRRDDEIFINSVCCKAAMEVLNTQHFLETGQLAASRSATLEALSRSGDETARQLWDCLQNRYLQYNGNIVEETCTFLLRHLETWFQQARDHREAEPTTIPQMLTGNNGGEFDAETEQSQITALTAVVSQWPGFRATHVVSSLSFSLEDLLIFIEVDPTQLPTAEEIARLISEFASPRIHILLLLPHATYQLDILHRGKAWQTIMNPVFNPDVYLQLGRDAPWTAPFSRFVRLEQQLSHDAFGRPDIYKTSPLTFLQGFWKSLQLAVIEHSARAGSVIYPTSTMAIQQGLQQHGLEPPSWLDQTAEGYRSIVAGQPYELGSLLPQAVEYGRQVSAWNN